MDSDHPELMVSFRYEANYTQIKTIIYKTDFISDIKYYQQVIQDFTMQQNYPNPFNSSTKIAFSQFKKNILNLSIYDISGKEVVTLFKNEQFLPGNYSVTWNGKNKDRKGVSSGIYLAVLCSKNFKSVRKMVLIR